MVYVFGKREEGGVQGGYRGLSGGERRLEGEGGGSGGEGRLEGGKGGRIGGEGRLEGEKGSRVEHRVAGGQIFQTRVRASGNHPRALG